LPQFLDYSWISEVDHYSIETRDHDGRMLALSVREMSLWHVDRLKA